jgi:hypothetical protein
MNIAQSAFESNPSAAPPGTPEHHRYWQTRLVIECSRARRARFPRNPELEANILAYWQQVFNTEGNNGSSTETT